MGVNNFTLQIPYSHMQTPLKWLPFHTWDLRLYHLSGIQ